MTTPNPTAATAPLSPEREAEIRERADAEKPGHFAIRDLLAELDRIRADKAKSTVAEAIPARWDRTVIHPDAPNGDPEGETVVCCIADDEPFCQELAEDEHPTCPTIRVHAEDAEKFAAMVDMVHELRNRVTELERAAVEGRAALADLVQDHDDPGTAALGALYLLSQTTTGVNAQPDDATRALARHDAATLDSAADELMNQADRLAGQYADSDITGDGPTAVLETWGRAEETVRRLAARADRGAVR